MGVSEKIRNWGYNHYLGRNYIPVRTGDEGDREDAGGLDEDPGRQAAEPGPQPQGEVHPARQTHAERRETVSGRPGAQRSVPRDGELCVPGRHAEGERADKQAGARLPRRPALRTAGHQG